MHIFVSLNIICFLHILANRRFDEAANQADFQRAREQWLASLQIVCFTIFGDCQSQKRVTDADTFVVIYSGLL